MTGARRVKIVLLWLVGVPVALFAAMWLVQWTIDLSTFFLADRRSIAVDVDTDWTLPNEVELARYRLAVALEKREIAFDGLEIDANLDLTLTGVDATAQGAVGKVLADALPDWDAEVVDARAWRITLPPAVRRVTIEDAIDTTERILVERLEDVTAGFVSATRSGKGGTRILFEFRTSGRHPDPAPYLGGVSRFELREVRYPPFVEELDTWIPPERPEDVVALFGGSLPPGTSLFEQYVDISDDVSTVLYWPLATIPTVVLEFDSVFVSTNEWGDPQLSCNATEKTGSRLETVTSRNVGRRLALTAAGWFGVEVMEVPSVSTSFGRDFMLPVPPPTDRAQHLAIAMHTGGLPARVTVVEQ